MRELFYYIVTMISEAITGLDHSNLKLWNFMTYIEVSDNVSIWLNAMIALFIAFIVLAIMGLIFYTKNRTFLED